MTITLRTARPGLVIGPKGAEVDKLREELEDMIERKVAPIKGHRDQEPGPERPARRRGDRRAAQEAGQLPPRAQERMESTMQAGAKGIKIRCAAASAGRKSPATKRSINGSVPLTTLQANMNYGYAIAVHDLRHDRREVLDLPRHVRRRRCSRPTCGRAAPVRVGRR